MRASLRGFLAALTLLAAISCGGKEPEPLIGNEIRFSAPVEAGSSRAVQLLGIERGTGSVGVVLAHMLGSSQSAWQPLVTRLADRDFHLLTFDFRGHGLSRGERDPSRAGLDLGAAVDKLRSLGASKLFVIGASMGGTAAVAVAVAQKVEGVVAISAPSQIDSLDVAESVRRLDEPSLFIVAERDDERFTKAAQLLASRAPEPKRLQVIRDTGAHGTDLLVDASVGGHVMDLIVDFLVANRG